MLLTMTERRLKGQRRWGLETLFPLTDGNGDRVGTNRRRLTDRRLCNLTLRDRLTLISGMLSPAPEEELDICRQAPFINYNE